MSPEPPVWFDELIAAQLVARRGVDAVVTNGHTPPLLLRQPGAGTLWASPQPAAYFGGTERTGWCEVHSASLGEACSGPIMAVTTGAPAPLLTAMQASGWHPDYVLSPSGIVLEGFAPVTPRSALQAREGTSSARVVEQLSHDLLGSPTQNAAMVDSLMDAAEHSDGVLRTRLTPDGEVWLYLSPLSCAATVSRAVLLRGCLPVEQGDLAITLPPMPPGAHGLELHFKGDGAPPDVEGFVTTSQEPRLANLSAPALEAVPVETLRISCPERWRLTQVVVRLPLPDWQTGPEFEVDPLDQYDADPFGWERTS